MPRRKKAELYDIVTAIIRMYVEEKKDIRTITSELRSQGYDISKSSIHRVIKDWKKAAEDYNRMFEEIKFLLESFKDKPVQYQLEAIAGLLASHALKFAKDIEALEFESGEEFALFIHRLTQALEKLTRFREERLKQLIEEAKKPETTKEDIIRKLEEFYGG